MKKKNHNKKILLILIAVIILGIIGYLLFLNLQISKDKFKTKDTNDVANRIFKCANNVFASRNRGGDAVTYVNGSNGEVLAKYWGYNPTNELFLDTCDFSKPADNVPNAILVYFNANQPIGFGDYDDVVHVPVKDIIKNDTAHLICHTSACCLGFGDTCAIFECANNIFTMGGGGDAASVYLNGSNGEVLARCGGNIMPLNPRDCERISDTCDYSKPADNVPSVIQNY